MRTFPGWWRGLGKEKQNVAVVELYSATNRKTPRYAIGVETLLDYGILGKYKDESEKLKALYSGKDTEIYHCLLIFKRSDIGITATERIFKRLS